MELTEKQKKAQEFLQTIITEAWRNETFKQELINSPVETLNVFTGKTANFPKDKKLVIVDQTNPNYIYLNIPAKPNLDDMELNEEQLEAIAGGASLWEHIAAYGIFGGATYMIDVINR